MADVLKEAAALAIKAAALDSKEAAQNSREATLAIKAAALDSRDATQNSREAALAIKAASLDSRDAELAARTAAIEITVAEEIKKLMAKNPDALFKKTATAATDKPENEFTREAGINAAAVEFTQMVGEALQINEKYYKQIKKVVFDAAMAGDEPETIVEKIKSKFSKLGLLAGGIVLTVVGSAIKEMVHGKTKDEILHKMPHTVDETVRGDAALSVLGRIKLKKAIENVQIAYNMDTVTELLKELKDYKAALGCLQKAALERNDDSNRQVTELGQYTKIGAHSREAAEKSLAEYNQQLELFGVRGDLRIQLLNIRLDNASSAESDKSLKAIEEEVDRLMTELKNKDFEILPELKTSVEAGNLNGFLRSLLGKAGLVRSDSDVMPPTEIMADQPDEQRAHINIQQNIKAGLVDVKSGIPSTAADADMSTALKP
ncbi:MAG: hypothetical protein ACHP65_06765 [Legionellales bacterium]